MPCFINDEMFEFYKFFSDTSSSSFNLFQPSAVFHIETSHLIWLVSTWNETGPRWIILTHYFYQNFTYPNKLRKRDDQLIARENNVYGKTLLMVKHSNSLRGNIVYGKNYRGLLKTQI